MNIPPHQGYRSASPFYGYPPAASPGFVPAGSQDGYRPQGPVPLPFLPPAGPAWSATPGWGAPAPAPTPQAYPSVRYPAPPMDPWFSDNPAPWHSSPLPRQAWMTLPPQAPAQRQSSPPLPSSPPPPSIQETPPAQDNSNLLNSLDRVKNKLSNADYAVGQALAGFRSAESNAAGSQADDAAYEVAKAAADNEQTDSSHHGKDAQAKLNSVSYALNQISSGSSQLQSASMVLNGLESELNGLDRASLPEPGLYDNLVSRLREVQRQLPQMQTSQGKLDDSAGDARHSLRDAGSLVDQVSADSDGKDVSRAASSAQSKIQTLRDQLAAIASQASDGSSSAQTAQTELQAMLDDAEALLSKVKWG